MKKVPWLSRYCLAPLALWELSGALSSLSIVWCPWLSGYCLVPLALQVLSGTLGPLGIIWHLWLSGYYLAPLALGIVWQPWLFRYCLASLALWLQKISSHLQKFIQGQMQKVPWLSRYCLVPLALWVLSCTLGSGYCLIPLALWQLSGLQVLSSALGSLGIVWCSWLSRYCCKKWHKVNLQTYAPPSDLLMQCKKTWNMS